MAENKPTVERDENGVPTSWLLVRAGPIPLRKNGEDYVLELTSKDLSGIVSCRRTRGGKLPPPEPRRHPPCPALSPSSKKIGPPPFTMLLPGSMASLRL